MEILKDLPNINKLKDEKRLEPFRNNYDNYYFTKVIRDSLDSYRSMILTNIIQEVNYDKIVELIIQNFKKSKYNLQPVVNATGTIIHTNLGRSLYSQNVIENMIRVASSYNNLEYNIEEQKRGSRYDHTRELISELTGCEDAIIVNNNAAAILLVLTSLVTNSEAIVSRGELIEIGGSFRVPEIMKFSNTSLCEVGTTNRTHVKDYEEAINSNTKAIVKIHPSNYKIMGFTSSVDVKEIATLAKKYNLISIEDIGSGSLINLGKYTKINEPTIQDSINAGIDIVTFSGDKLLGGVQAGFIIGKRELIDKIKQNNLLRSLRVDKLTLAAIEANLHEYLDETYAINNIPTLKMITESPNEVHNKAKKLLQLLDSENFSIEQSKCVIGGGSLPTEELDSYKIVLNFDYNINEMISKLHNNYYPIIAKVENDKVCLDVKTLSESDFEIIKEFFDNYE